MHWNLTTLMACSNSFCLLRHWVWGLNGRGVPTHRMFLQARLPCQPWTKMCPHFPCNPRRICVRHWKGTHRCCRYITLYCIKVILFPLLSVIMRRFWSHVTESWLAVGIVSLFKGDTTHQTQHNAMKLLTDVNPSGLLVAGISFVIDHRCLVHYVSQISGHHYCSYITDSSYWVMAHIIVSS